MEEFNYKKVAKEIGWNFSKIEIKTEQSVDFDYYEEVAKNINENTVMLIAAKVPDSKTRLIDNINLWWSC